LSRTRNAKSVTKTRRGNIRAKAASCCPGCNAKRIKLRLGRLGYGRDFCGDGNLREGDISEGVALLAPSVQAALQGADVLNALLPKEQRHTGAGGFVWSSTVEDDLAVTRQATGGFLQFLGVHTKCTGDGFRVGFEVQRVAKVDDDQIFAVIDLLL
jgi:hypothetical protein